MRPFSYILQLNSRRKHTKKQRIWVKDYNALLPAYLAFYGDILAHP